MIGVDSGSKLLTASGSNTECTQLCLTAGLLEMRGNGWAVRREVEGPRKIADVHREAQEQLQRQRSADV